MPRTNREPSLLGFGPLLARGVPVGALAEPNRFFQVKTGAKLHATRTCSRLRESYPLAVYRDLRYTGEDTLCRTCVTGPTHPATLAYIDAAGRALRATETLDVIDADLGGGAELTWRHVTAARAALTLVRDVLAIDGLHPDLAGYAAPILTRAAARAAELRAAADELSDPDAVVRGCLIDNLGISPNGGPETASPPVPATLYQDGRPVVPLPALAASRYRPAGHGGLAAAAWAAWAARMKTDADMAAARDAAQAAGTPPFGDLPTDVGQLPKGPAVLEHAPGAPPWDRVVAEWRHQLTQELAELITFWEQRYTATAAEARQLPGKVLSIDNYDRDSLTKVNPATAILGRLELAADPVKRTGLVLAPAPVADWLGTYDITGEARSYGRTSLKVLAEAVPGDGRDVLELALKLFDRPENRAAGHVKLADALTAARGILSPVAD